MLRPIKSRIIFLLLAGWVATATAAFRDPLDVPAIQLRVHAESSPMTAIGKAGDRLVAVGRRGVILVSADAGRTWRQAAVPVSVDLTAVNFTSPSAGWVAGHGGVILYSGDGGDTWTRRFDGRQLAALLGEYYAERAQDDDPEAARVLPDAKRFSEDGPIHPLLDIWFESELVGYVVGAFNLILRTNDGGQSWTPLLEQTENPRKLHLYSVRGVADGVYVVGEQGLVLRLDRRTQRFRALPTEYKGSFFGLVQHRDNLVVFGLRGNAFRSPDSGRTWQKVETRVQSSLTGAAVLADGRLVLASQGGKVLLSSDPGQAFSDLNVARPMPFAGVVPVDAGHIALVGPSGVSVEALK